LSFSIGAILIKLGMGLNMILLVVITAFMCSSLLISLIKPYVRNSESKDRQKREIFNMVEESITAIRSSKTISRIFLIFGLAWLVGSSIDIYLISYLQKVLNRGTEDLYLITIFSLVGIIIGSSLAPQLYNRIDKKIGFYLSSLIFGVVILGYALKLPLLLLLILLLFGGVSQGVFLTFLNSYLQDITSQEFFGRI